MNTTPTSTSVCGNCGVEERRLLLLHHVRHRGLFRRLCTSCVLRLHPQSFCPTCFLVYSPPLLPPPSSTDAVSCLKCDSFSHPHCAGGPNRSPASPYTCPPCANPGTPIFDTSKRELDKRGAKVLLAAVKVAAGSMSKAAAGARAEAEKRAKEAAFARKRAREALEHVAFLVAREKVKRKESVAAASAEVSVAKERNHKAAPIMELNRVGNQRAVEGVDGPNEVSARLNAVGLREKERLQGFGGLSVVSGIQNNGSGMAVENNERPRVSPASNVGAPFTQSNVNERSDNLGHLENTNAQGEKVSNGLYSVLPVGDQMKHVQSNHGREEKMGSQQ
ncbi:hypothetical protein RHMOL_Rhmol11G0163700 [Rhododendron molle]|uniref:Uncharacterized protein n=1 Tax=Rhododendron molle TaxID=49168 RepID=A0ACC0LT16_RHOML|nr:hypothetical protein RHMOL_Rhmol11G0163700 [Rhododendron molle]